MSAGVIIELTSLLARLSMKSAKQARVVSCSIPSFSTLHIHHQALERDCLRQPLKRPAPSLPAHPFHTALLSKQVIPPKIRHIINAAIATGVQAGQADETPTP
jgi:hypothetical protein